MRTGIRKIEAAAAGIRVFEHAPLEGTPLPRCTAGAHIDAHLPAGLVSQYTRRGSPHQSDVYDCGARRG
jgi:vanillate O-demethylase ferredoxin subunit